MYAPVVLRFNTYGARASADRALVHGERARGWRAAGVAAGAPSTSPGRTASERSRLRKTLRRIDSASHHPTGTPHMRLQLCPAARSPVPARPGGSRCSRPRRALHGRGPGAPQAHQRSTDLPRRALCSPSCSARPTWRPTWAVPVFGCWICAVRPGNRSVPRVARRTTPARAGRTDWAHALFSLQPRRQLAGVALDLPALAALRVISDYPLDVGSFSVSPRGDRAGRLDGGLCGL